MIDETEPPGEPIAGRESESELSATIHQSAQGSSSVLNWSSSDAKLLIITFLGTITANLVTILFVGLAIALTRTLPRVHRTIWDDLFFVYPLLICAVTAYLLFATRSMWGKRTRFLTPEWVDKHIFIVLGTITMGGGLVFLLVLIGLASGLN